LRRRITARVAQVTPPELAAFTASLGFAIQARWGFVGAAVFLSSQKIMSR
jgi:hypothetical protein